jgi:membrane-associated HD superfamily phosphohydrolase
MWSLAWLRVIRDPARVLVFGLLLGFHAVGHWISTNLIHDPRALRRYFIAQGAIVLALALLSNNPLIAFLLIVPLAGVAVLLVGQVRASLPVLAGYILLLLAVPIALRHPFELSYIIFNRCKTNVQVTCQHTKRRNSKEWISSLSYLVSARRTCKS